MAKILQTGLRSWLRRAEVLSALGLGGAALIVLLHHLLPIQLAGLLSALVFIGCVLAAGVLGGWRSGVAVTTIHVLSAAYFINEPRYSFWIEDRNDLLRLMAFGILGVIISGLCELLRQAWKRIDERQRRLEQEVIERRKAEQSAQARADELHVTLASIGDGVITTGADGRVLYLNHSAELLTGWHEAEAAGQPLDAVFRLIDSKWKVPIDCSAARMFGDAAGIQQPVNAELVAKTGEEHSLEVSISPIRGSLGELNGSVLIFRDVGERRRSQEKLRQSEERFVRFMEHLPGLAWIKDLHGRYSFVNDAAEKAFGLPRDQLYGKTDDQVFPPDTAAQFIENDQRALQSESGVQLIETLADEAGVLRHSLVNKFPIPDREGRPSLVGGIAIDVTDRLNAEQDLRRHKERLELAQHAGRIGTFEWNIQTGEVEWSAIEEEIFGLAPGSFGGRFENWQQTVHPDDRERAVAQFLEAVRQRSDLSTLFRIIRPDGEVRWITAQSRVYADDNGRPLRMVGVNLDITQEKLAEMARQEADRRKDIFLATLAHELRNPLAPVQNSLAILKLPGVDSDMTRQALDMMERQVQLLVRLVDDLLDVSRVMRGKIDLRLEPVDLGDIVSRAAETVQPLIEQYQHELQIEFPKEPLFLRADSLRLSQVLGNLLANAAKYTEPRGRIVLSARRQGPQAVISVRDNGIGISKEMLPHVFELFVQADQAIARAQGGLGIGLTLVKNLMELHGGTVAAYSRGLGHGSEFVLQLPLLTPTPAERDGVSPTAGFANCAAKRRLLVVDDNQDAARSLAMLLRVQGHDVMVSHDGPSALELGATFHPEMVFLDLGMPGMDGYEVARRFRHHPHLNHVVLTALTGWGQSEDRRRTTEAGFDHHLVKPANLDDINRIVEALNSKA